MSVRCVGLVAGRSGSVWVCMDARIHLSHQKKKVNKIYAVLCTPKTNKNALICSLCVCVCVQLGFQNTCVCGCVFNFYFITQTKMEAILYKASRRSLLIALLCFFTSSNTSTKYVTVHPVFINATLSRMVLDQNKQSACR